LTKISDIMEDGGLREAILKQFGPDADVSTLAKGFVDTKKHLSSTRRVPGEDATPEDWGKFYNSMGRPERHDGYAIPDEVDHNLRGTLEGIRETAHNRGLTEAQWSALVNAANEKAAESSSKLGELKSSWEQNAREQLGENADKRLELANQTLEKIMADDPAAAEVMKQTGLDRHPAILDALLKAGDLMGEDSAPPVGGSPSEAPGDTPEQLYTEAIELMHSEEFKNKKHPLSSMKEARYLEILMALHEKGLDLNSPRFTSRPQAFMPDGTRII